MRIQYRSACFPVFILLFFSGLSGAQNNTLQDFFMVKRISDIALSPSGSHILYRIDESDPGKDVTVSSIWKIETSGKNATKLADDAIAPRWSPDEKQVAFLDTAKGYQLGLIELEHPEKRTVVTEATGGVWDFEWSPNGKWIAFVAAIPSSASQGGPVLMSENRRKNGLYLLELATRKIRLMTADHQDVMFAFGRPSIAWSPSGKEIVFAIQEEPGFEGIYFTDLYAVSIDTQSTRRLVHRPGIDCCPTWSVDGSRIAFFSSYEAVDRLANCGISIISAEGGKPNDIGKSLEAGFFDSASYAWDAENRLIYVELIQKAFRKLVALDARTGEFQDVIIEQASLSHFSFSKDRKTVAFRKSRPDETWELYVSQLDSWKSRKLTSLNNDLKIPVTTAEMIHWNSSGNQIDAILLKPPKHQDGQRYPLIVVIHAGPEISAEWSFDISWFANFESNPNVLQFLSSCGYALLIPNFRGSGGYGEKFRRAIFQNCASATLEDIRGGVQHLIRRNLIRENQVGLLGWSYGGYAIGWMLGQTSEFKAAVAGAPPMDLRMFYGEGVLDIWVHSMLGGPPWKVPQLYERHSPISYAHKITTPTLVVYGQSDPLVPAVHPKSLYHVLQVQGTPVELALYPNQSHSFESPKFMKDVAERVAAWFDRWLLQ